MRKRIRNRPTPARLQQHIEAVVAELRQNPDKLEIVKANIEHFKTQRHLKRGFLIAIDRFDWVFEAHTDINKICDHILADDYIGKRLRRYPLLFKGVLNKTE